MFEGVKDITRFMIASRRSQDLGFNTIALQNSGISQTLKHQESKRESQLQCVDNAPNECVDLLIASPIHRTESAYRSKNLESATPTEGYLTPRSRSPFPSALLERERTCQELKAILSKLSVDSQSDVAADDTSMLLKLIYTLSLPSQDRAVALMTSPDLQSWVASTSCCALLVNGRMAYSEHETRHSPLSYFCAKMVDSALSRTLHPGNESNNTIFVVRWFCGQHTNMATDYDAHPPGMLNNLIAQLVNQCLEGSYPPLISAVSLQDIAPKLSNFCYLFVRLVEALPEGAVVFCIIDGISYYEDTGRRTECWEVLSTFVDLARRKSDAIHGLFKLLVTAPLRSHYVQELFIPAETFDLNEYVPPIGGFTASQWDFGVGRAIDE